MNGCNRNACPEQSDCEKTGGEGGSDVRVKPTMRRLTAVLIVLLAINNFGLKSEVSF